MAITQEDIDATLGSVTPVQNNAAAVNVDNVNQGYDFNMTPEMQDAYDQYQRANNPSAGMLPVHQYYPTLGENVAVGGYSGNQIGSTTLFAPGGAVVPLGMLDARDKAIQAAALKKQADVDNFLKKFKSPTSKLVNINDQLRDEYFNHLEGAWSSALKSSGGDPSKAAFSLKNNMDFQQREKAFHDLAKFGDDIVLKVAKDEEEIKSGRFVPTPTYKELKTKLYTALDPNDPEFKNSGNIFRKMQLERDFSDAFNEVTKKMVADQTGYAYDKMNDPEFAKVYEGTIKQWSPEQKKAVADALSENIYGGSDYFTKEKIQRDVNGLLSGKQVERKEQLVRKPEPEGGADFTYTDNDIAKEPSSTNVFTKNQMGAVAEGESVGDFGVQHKKPIKTILPTGRTVYINDDKNGLIKTAEVSPNANVQLFKTELVKVYDGNAKEHEGTPLSEQQIKDGRKWKWAVMTKGVITEGTGNEKTEKQFFVPTKEVQNVLVKKRDANGAVQQGIPVDKLEAEAVKRNSSLGSQSSNQKTTSTPAKKKDPLGLGI